MKTKSLKTVIIFRLFLPVIFFVTLEVLLSYYVALHYTNKTYDKWLLDSAMSLSQEVKMEGDRIVADLPQEALEIFKWDQSDETFFKIIAENQGIVAGDLFVPELLDDDVDWSVPAFFNDRILDKPVRVVSMFIHRKDLPENVFVHVAETVNKRQTMMLDILLSDIVPQLILASIICLFIYKAILHSLKPLHAMAHEIAQRSPQDLSPVSETNVYKEVHILTDTINALLLRLTNAIASQQRFIANASHQLRTPIAGLKLQAERAQREDNVETIRPAMAHIQSSADRISHIIDQLLVLTKSESIEGKHHFEYVDLYVLARELCMEWAPVMLQKHVELTFESKSNMIPIKGNRILLKEALSNLLANALAYGYQNGRVTVRVDASEAPCVIVEDNGPGIEDSEINRIFERFYRVPGSRGEGCGLGLAIVKEIADLHNAQLTTSRTSKKGGLRIVMTFMGRQT
jgi:signal transduction histidine kinase